MVTLTPQKREEIRRDFAEIEGILERLIALLEANLEDYEDEEA